MSGSTNQTVTIDIVADAKKFREELKKASSDANAFNKGMKDVKKAGGKQDKDLSRLAKDANKFNKKAANESIDYEKKLLNLMKQRQNEMKKIGNQESSQYKAKRKEAAEAAKVYSDLRSNRAKAGNEGGRGLGSRIGRGAYNGLVGGALGIGGLAIGALTARVGAAGGAASSLFGGGINLAGDRSITSKQGLLATTKAGADYGYSPEDTSAQAAAMSRATGFGADVTHGQQFARAGMLDMGQATSFMGLQAKGGSGNPAEQKRDLERILANAFSTGLEKGRFGEYLAGIASLVEGAQSRTAGNVDGTGYAKSMSLIGAGGQSGLTGARGASVLSQLEQGFMHGGGAAGKALSLSAMGFGTPGGGTSYYDATKAMQQGFSGEKGSGNMMKMLNNLKYRYGGNTEAAALAGGEQTGLSLDIMEKLLSLTEDGTKLQDEIAEITKEAVPLEQQVADVLKGELSTQAKIQSGRQQELVQQGSLVVDSLNDLQDSTNRMIDKYWPVAVRALDIIAKTVDVVAQAVTDSYDFWQNIPMFGEGSDDDTPADTARKVSESLAKDVQRQIKTGMLDETVGMRMLKTDRDTNRKLQGETSEVAESTKYGLAADESSKAVTKLMNSHGNDSYTQSMMADQAKQAQENEEFKKRETTRRQKEEAVRQAERDRIAALPVGVEAPTTVALDEKSVTKIAQAVTPKAKQNARPLSPQ